MAHIIVKYNIRIKFVVSLDKILIKQWIANLFLGNSHTSVIV